jgi:hypothetical protein
MLSSSRTAVRPLSAIEPFWALPNCRPSAFPRRRRCPPTQYDFDGTNPSLPCRRLNVSPCQKLTFNGRPSGAALRLKLGLLRTSSLQAKTRHCRHRQSMVSDGRRRPSQIFRERSRSPPTERELTLGYQACVRHPGFGLKWPSRLCIRWLHSRPCWGKIPGFAFALKKPFAMNSWKLAMGRTVLPRRLSGNSCGNMSPRRSRKADRRD